MEPDESDSAVARLQRARREARDRLATGPDRRGLFLALGRVDVETPLDVGDYFVIERLEAPPSIFGSDLTKRMSPRYQLAMVLENPESMDDSLVSVMWTCLALLRIATDGLIVPCEIAGVSWDVIDGSPLSRAPGTSPVMTEVPRWWPIADTRIGADEAAWVGKSLVTTLKLRADRKFHFALESFDGSYEETDPRMAAAKVWGGIEGLFGISSELRFRLALYVAAVLCPPGPERLELNKKMRRLYDERSKVVHGADVEPAALTQHVLASQEILGGLLRDAIMLGRMRTIDEVEARLLQGAEGAS